MPLNFDQTTAEQYKDQLQIYQDKINAGSITQVELNQAQSLTTQYYQFLSNSGIGYGDIASQVIQGSTFYGQYANEL